MGTTLDNGTYLPDEGERNCYEGLAGNWVALDNHLGSTNIHVTINDKQAWNGHIADTTIHVTAEDKQAWNGKADASALTAHTGNATIHVTAEDKAKWDAVTSKADDSAVMHLTGNETSTGLKVFENISLSNSIKAINLEKLTIDLNNCYSTFGSPSSGNISYYFCNTNDGTTNISNLPENRAFFLISQGIRILSGGSVVYAKQTCITINNTYVRYCKNSIWTSWNNIHDELEPGSLSLPSGNANDVIDISSYITALDGTSNSYTAPANGWISIAVVGIAIAIVSPSWSDSRLRASSGDVRMLYPVLKNETLDILVTGTTLAYVRFIPCQGNV